MRHLLSNPSRNVEGFVDIGEFDFRDDQTGILSGEDIDFPRQVSLRNQIANFSIKGPALRLSSMTQA